MKRRLTWAILIVTVMTLLILGIPLAIVVHRYYEKAATVDLQRRAAEAVIEVPTPLDGSAADELAEATQDAAFSVYDAQGALVAGSGPVRADAAVRAALAGVPTFDHSTEVLVYATPLTDPQSEAVTAVVRVAEPDAAVDGRIRRAWLVMFGVGLVALAIAWAVALAQARRLARPIQDLAASAERLGAGGVVLAHQRSGVVELDLLGHALATSSVRLAELLARERAFSADVSHQLRTPLTGLRLRLEADASNDPANADALADVARLEATVDHLLALSRGRPRLGTEVSLSDVVEDSARRWRPRFADAGREIDLLVDRSVEPVVASLTALEQIVDVLLDNALEHGAGRVSIVSRAIAGGSAIDVGDGGRGVPIEEATAIFARHHGSGHGIGLALARSLAEAEGGKLVLASNAPPRFSLVFASAVTRTAAIPSLTSDRLLDPASDQSSDPARPGAEPR